MGIVLLVVNLFERVLDWSEANMQIAKAWTSSSGVIGL